VVEEAVGFHLLVNLEVQAVAVMEVTLLVVGKAHQDKVMQVAMVQVMLEVVEAVQVL
jgi:hypothetical protein